MGTEEIKERVQIGDKINFNIESGLWSLVNEHPPEPIKIELFDTHLRDGEQGGRPFTDEAKYNVAEHMARVGINTIEVGFPSSNQMEYDIVKRVADNIQGPYICGLTTMEQDKIVRTWDALKNNPNPTVHIFTLNIDEASVRAYDQNIEDQIRMASEAVAFAKDLMGGRGRIEFSAQNTILALYQSLSDEHAFLQDYIARIYGGAIREGADIINIPHTVAKGVGIRIQDAVKYFKALVQGTEDVKLSFHAHNDYGLGTADTLAAIEAGIEQVEGTWYNNGERAGNTALEQVISNIMFNPNYNTRFFTDFDMEQLCPTMRVIEKETGMPIPHNAAFGPNSFSHGAGVHQDGDTKAQKKGISPIYLPCNPEEVGWTGVTNTITKLVGTSGVHARFNEMGYDFDRAFVKDSIMPIIKSEDRIYGDVDLRIIGDAFRYQGAETIEFGGFASNKFLNSDQYLAQCLLKIDGKDRLGEVFMGNVGSIDSLFESIDNILDLGDDKPKLVVYDPKNTGRTHKTDAEAIVVLSGNGPRLDYHLNEPVWIGTGKHPDTISASAIAYVQALARYVVDLQKK